MPAFTAPYAGHEVTWTHQADGWRGAVDSKQAIGIWSVDGLSVWVTDAPNAGKTNLSEYIEIDRGDDQKIRVSVDQHPVAIASMKSTVTPSQGEDGIFKNRL